MPLVYSNIRLKRFTILRVFLVIVFTALTIATIQVTSSPIKLMLDCGSDEPVCQHDKRVQSIVSISTSLVIAMIAVAGVGTVLNVAGVHTGSILAGAGIIGLVIGLGAQSVIKDIVTGILIISENQISVGDYVQLTNVHSESISGTVTALSVRIMKLQKQDGSIAFVPSGNIAHITNFSRTSQIVMVVVDVPLAEDIRGVSESLQAMATDLYSDPNVRHLLVSAPELQAVQGLSGNGYSVRIRASVKPGNQWAVGRYIRLQAIQRLQELQVNSPQVYVNLSQLNSPSLLNTLKPQLLPESDAQDETARNLTAAKPHVETRTANVSPQQVQLASAQPTAQLPSAQLPPAQTANLAGLPRTTVVL